MLIYMVVILGRSVIVFQGNVCRDCLSLEALIKQGDSCNVPNNGSLNQYCSDVVTCMYADPLNDSLVASILGNGYASLCHIIFLMKIVAFFPHHDYCHMSMTRLAERGKGQ
jgi:hypothetical protein